MSISPSSICCREHSVQWLQWLQLQSADLPDIVVGGGVPQLTNVLLASLDWSILSASWKGIWDLGTNHEHIVSEMSTRLPNLQHAQDQHKSIAAILAMCSGCLAPLDTRTQVILFPRGFLIQLGPVFTLPRPHSPSRPLKRAEISGRG